VTDFPPGTGTLLVSLRVTVIVDVLTPSAVTVAELAATVELAADVVVAAGSVPSPGSSPVSFPSPTVTLKGAEKRWG
jgi:hypothetical protein